MPGPVPIFQPREQPEVPTRRGDDPVKGWKLARAKFTSSPGMVIDREKAEFRGAVFPLGYRPTPTSSQCGCHSSDPGATRANHTEIGIDTHCGFHALKTKNLDTAGRMMGWGHLGMMYLLEVELWGTVVHCEKGYRASRQRVLSCRPYGAPIQPGSQVSPFSILHDQESIFYTTEYGTEAPRVRLSLSDATSLLGTEVVYDESVLAVGWQRQVDTKVRLTEVQRELEKIQAAAKALKNIKDSIGKLGDTTKG